MSATTEIQDFNKRVRLTNSGTVAMSNGVDNTLTWDTESIDTDTMHEGVTNPARITFNTAGDYVVGASVSISTLGTLILKINLNAVPTVIAEAKDSGGVTHAAYIKTVYTFAQGDYIYLTANPSLGGDLEARSSFFAYRIG